MNALLVSQGIFPPAMRTLKSSRQMNANEMVRYADEAKKADALLMQSKYEDLLFRGRVKTQPSW